MRGRAAASRSAVHAPVRLTDGVIDAIRDRLCSVPPERGGALLGCGSLVHVLLEDTHGRYSSASWDMSAELSTAVGLLEQARHGRLVGTVHTHPKGVPDPSPTDVASTGRMLEINPHLAELLIAVVTEGRPRTQDVRLGSRLRMSLHVLRRGPHQHTVLQRVPGTVVPLCADLASAGLDLPSGTSVRRRTSRGRENPATGDDLASIIHVNNRPRLIVPVPSAPGRVGALFVDAEYPVVGPLAVTWEQGDGSHAGKRSPRPELTALPSPWDPTASPQGQLAGLARAAVGRRMSDATDRVWPLVGDLSSRHAVVCGLGSVGSCIAEHLVRSGVGSLTLIDPDTVDGANLARTVYAAADVGMRKTTALARRLRAVDPAVRVDEYQEPLGNLGLAEVLEGADLVVGATDDMAEQAVLAHHAYAAGIPMVACALYRAAAAGEVVLSVPEAQTACWNCAVGSGGGSGAHRPEPDYGLDGRLVGEAALGPSIHLVTCAASQAAIGILAGSSSSAGVPLRRLIRERRTLGLVSTAPDWGFFPKVIPSMPHQYAPQSVWAVVKSDPACPICGDISHRTPPLTSAQGLEVTGIIEKLRDEAAVTQEEGVPEG
ncbi:ThiF family adenylyltransferase [Streptomyces sp. NPDC052079]|uniref:ThiF family adenylyltransferase n=1 Tax=Streptomyces sp. NPDC052079 TaxID=3155526 RepID=UPI00343664E1